jgi:hypothetical protein
MFSARLTPVHSLLDNPRTLEPSQPSSVSFGRYLALITTMILLGTGIADLAVGLDGAEPMNRFELIGVGVAIVAFCVCEVVNYW